MFCDTDILSLCEDTYPKVYRTGWLNGDGIVKEIPDPGPLLTPFDRSAVGPASVDLRIGTSFSAPGDSIFFHIIRNGVASSSHGFEKTDGDSIHLDPESVRKLRGVSGDIHGFEIPMEPGFGLMCCSLEYIRMPPDVCGLVTIKSSRSRSWLYTSGCLIHPGFHGMVSFMVTNVGAKTQSIRTGMSIVQMSLMRMNEVPANPYFKGGSYQGQRHDLRPFRREGSR